jgi:hypothetical protein
MLNLTHDQRSLLDFLAENVRELLAAAQASASSRNPYLVAEAEELTAIRARLVNRLSGTEPESQLQLPLEMKEAA